MTIDFLSEKSSFTSGEIGEALHAREDLARYQTGVEKLENYVVLVEAGVTRRSGTRFVLELKDEGERGRLAPFRYSGSDNYMLVFNGGVMRILKDGGFLEDGGLPYELAVPFSEADMPRLRYLNSGNDMWFARGVGGLPQHLVRSGHTSWAIGDYVPDNGPVDLQNLNQGKTVQASAVTGAVTLTGVGNPFAAGMVGSVLRLDEPNVGAVPLWKANETVAVNDQRRYQGRIYEVVSGTSTGANPPTHEDGTASAGQGDVTWRYLHSGYGFVRVTGFTDPNSVAGNVLKRLPNSVQSAATYRWYPPAWSVEAGYPEYIHGADRRLLWTRGPFYWTTRTNSTRDYEVEADKDDTALSGRVTSPDGSLVNIEWVISSGVVVLGCRDLEYILRGPDAFGGLTNAARPIDASSEGSAPHVPQRVDKGAIFIGKSRDRLHYTAFDRFSEDLQTEDLTLAARHILQGRASALAWQRDPHRICWVALEDGTLAALTFLPDAEVARRNHVGWHRHPMTNAFVEDIASISSTDEGESEVYMIVRRVINGETRRYVEKLMPFFKPLNRAAPTAEGAWIVDSGIEYNGDETNVITGLDHLEGQEVAVFIKGTMHPRCTVEDGSITLQRRTTHCLVGLPIVARIRDLPRNAQTQKGTTRGKKKRAPAAIINVLHSHGGAIRYNDGLFDDLFPTGTMDYGAPLPLMTGAFARTMEADWGDQAVTEIVNDDAMPFTLLGLHPFIESQM